MGRDYSWQIDQRWDYFCPIFLYYFLLYINGNNILKLINFNSKNSFRNWGTRDLLISSNIYMDNKEIQPSESTKFRSQTKHYWLYNNSIYTWHLLISSLDVTCEFMNFFLVTWAKEFKTRSSRPYKGNAILVKTEIHFNFFDDFGQYAGPAAIGTGYIYIFPSILHMVI